MVFDHCLTEVPSIAEVQSGIQRIQGAPNFAVENLRNSAAGEDSNAALPKYSRRAES